jgi:hypothetical protein
MIQTYIKNIKFTKSVLFLAIAGLTLSGCGFNIMYKTEGNSSYYRELAAIQIKDVHLRTNQELKNDLLDIFNYDNIKVEPKYLLSLTINKLISPTFINNTGASGRNHIILNVKYELKDISNLEIIASGESSVADDFNVETRRFGNYIAEDHIQSNLLKLVAENIRSLLVSDLIEINKNAVNGRGGEIRTPDPLVPNQMR